jgi:putative flippase GtrA
VDTLAAVDVPAERTALFRVVFPRYAAVGALSVAIDVGLLSLLHSVAHVELILATTLSFAAALLVNYSLNHVWAFDAGGLSWHRLYRYAVLVVINYGITVGLVAGLTSVGAYYLVAKAIAVAIAACINFTGYRLWVFR